MSNNKTVTMPISEYDHLLEKIRQKDAYIQKHINEGKVKIGRPIVININENNYRSAFWVTGGLGELSTLKCEFDNYSKDSLDHIKNYNESRITEAIEKLNKWKSDFNKRLSKAMLEYVSIKDMESYSFADRLVFLFRGKL